MTMTEFKYSEDTSKKSNSIIELNYINAERKAKYVKTFFNGITGEKFERNDVQILKYKRNIQIKEFFRKYSSNSDYTMIEIGIDFKTTNRVADVLLKLKRNLNKIGLKPLEYFWLVDKGDVFDNMHFHLIVAVDKIDLKGKPLPKELKLIFKEKKIHSSFIRNKPKMMQYLLKKEIYYIGKRKRIYGTSRKQKVQTSIEIAPAKNNFNTI
jgi:hypothetical protein